MVNQTAEEIRKAVLEEDAKKDVGISIAIYIAIISGISSVAAITAIITARALVYFRHGIDVYWMCCVPFLFPVVTGLFASYKKQLALLGVHLCVNMLTLLMGGFGFGLSVEPLFIYRHDCQQVHIEVPCEKESLSYLYVISGAIAAGFAVIDFIITLIGLQLASKRIAKRKYDALVHHRQEQADKQKEIRRQKMMEYEGRRRAFSVCSTTSNPQAVPLQYQNHQEAGRAV